MPDLRIRLFGRFEATHGVQNLTALRGGKPAELFAYLLVNRGRWYSREALADMLWGESSGERALKYLRQALWQLRRDLRVRTSSPDHDVIVTDRHWIRFDPGSGVWIDLVEFDHAFSHYQTRPSSTLKQKQVETLKTAVQLYRGDLLEGWYQDWCVFERERVRRQYLELVAGLMAHLETRREFEAGVSLGTAALRYDAADERIHRLLMRLHYFSGNRTAAMRQYQACVRSLRKELDALPSSDTVALFDLMRSGQLSRSTHPVAGP